MGNWGEPLPWQRQVPSFASALCCLTLMISHSKVITGPKKNNTAAEAHLLPTISTTAICCCCSFFIPPTAVAFAYGAAAAATAAAAAAPLFLLAHSQVVGRGGRRGAVVGIFGSQVEGRVVHEGDLDLSQPSPGDLLASVEVC